MITRHARAESLDLDYVGEQTRRTAHSMLGLIRGLQQVLPESAREHVYVGATVQTSPTPGSPWSCATSWPSSGATCAPSKSPSSRSPWLTATR